MNRGRNTVQAGRDVTVGRFRPEDAEGVARLFLTVYGENYPISVYLDPGRLREENAAENIISSVARTPDGDIVGHNALFRSAPYKGVYESGAGLVHPDYRGGKGIFTALVAHGEELGKTIPSVELIFGDPVCNHVYSQRLTHGLEWRTVAVEVDLMPGDAYAKEGGATDRVSSILDVKTIRPKTVEVNLPGRYEEPLRFLYDGLDDERTLVVAREGPPSGSLSRVVSQYYEFAGITRLSIYEIGRDFENVIGGVEETVKDQGAIVIQAWVNTGVPWCGEAVEVLRSRGYSLGGILPRWFDSDGLLMTWVSGRPHWEEMALYTERARQVAALARKDWASLKG